MSEDTNTTQATEEVKLSDVEKRAMEQGWRPQEEWDGAPEEWRSAKEFLDRGELLSRISNQSSELKELRKTVSYLTDHHKKVKETEFNRAIQYLREQKKVALQDQDGDKLVEIEEAIDNLKEQQRQAVAETPKVDVPNAPHPAYVAFLEKNSWYSTDAEMKTFADEIGVGKKATNPSITPEELFTYVEKQVKRVFSEKFTKKSATPAVEGVSGSGKASGGKKEPALTDEERRVMNNFIRAGIMSKEEYLSELQAIKGE